MDSPYRRTFLARAAVGGLWLTPLLTLLTACRQSQQWPPGMVEIHWDRDVCARCGMVISDRRFAAQINADDGHVGKFDDIGCLLCWLRDQAATQPWTRAGVTRFWVAAQDSSAEHPVWLDPRAAHYLAQTSPMGYNFVAVAQPRTDSLPFARMRARVLERDAAQNAVRQGKPHSHDMSGMREQQEIPMGANSR
ncbi:MAG: nitrous oxide reductase accessory protein NosL [Zoogloeaceae bacterium]|jgi:nitrous oxide reductase accessory protein NosL|nr:nitrous oxide reductase accessory protein NosL [Zoogloeaceae bacterium]